jgi:hypothetical protein
MVSLLSLTSARGRNINWSRTAVDTVMLEVVRQTDFVVTRIVTRLMLPAIAQVAGYRPAIVVGVATDAADLAVVCRHIAGFGSSEALMRREV